MSEYDVIKLARHSDYRTTFKYYLVVKEDLIDRARMATAHGLCKKLVQLGVMGM